MPKNTPLALAPALLALCGCVALRPAPLVRPPADACVILTPQHASGIHRFAAEELAQSLQAATGRRIPVRTETDKAPEGLYALHVGIRAPGDEAPLAPEEGRCAITETSAYFYGDDAVIAADPAARREALNPANRAGTLFAVYEFLERECGVRWVVPGARGTIVPSRDPLALRCGRTSWRPRLQQRRMRDASWDWASLGPLQLDAPAELRVTQRAAADRLAESLLWLRRHRLETRAPRRAGAPLGAAEQAPAPPVEFLRLPAGTGVQRAAALWREARKPSERTVIHQSDALLANVGLPLGREKQLFDLFQVGLRHDMAGTDYAFLPISWWLDGLACYALARAHTHPETPFSVWEAEFCSLFGAAAFDVKQYYRYWRRHFTEKIAPARDRAVDAGWGSWETGLCLTVGDHFSLNDFRTSVGFLHDALTRELAPEEKSRLQELVLAHEHAELVFLALEAVNRTNDTPEKLEKALTWARRLADFRRHFQQHLRGALPRLAAQEKRLGDVTGGEWAGLFKDADPVRRLPLEWRFRPDPEDVGEEKRWCEAGVVALGTWVPATLDRPWDRQGDAGEPQADEAEGDRCDIGWYAAALTIEPELSAREVFLNFHGLRSSCKVFVNGKLTGERHYREGAGDAISFRLRVDPGFGDLERKQVVVIRAHASPGAPAGIWRPIWLSARGKADGGK